MIEKLKYLINFENLKFFFKLLDAKYYNFPLQLYFTFHNQRKKNME